MICTTPNGSGLMARELVQDCVEMRTPVFSEVRELARRLLTLRRERGRRRG